MDDRDLLEQVRKQNIHALEQLIDKYCEYVFTVIRNQLGNACSEYDVEELASDVFFTLWQKCPSISTSRLQGWLAAVAKNKTRSFQRSRRVRPETVGLDDVITVSEDLCERLFEKKEQSRILHTAIQELGEPDSRIFSLYYYSGQSVSSIAKQLSLHPEAVKSKIRRGREKLKQILLREGDLV